MNMLASDSSMAMSHDFLRVSQYVTIPPKFYKKKSETVVRLGVRENRREIWKIKSNITVRK